MPQVLIDKDLYRSLDMLKSIKVIRFIMSEYMGFFQQSGGNYKKKLACYKAEKLTGMLSNR